MSCLLEKSSDCVIFWWRYLALFVAWDGKRNGKWRNIKMLFIGHIIYGFFFGRLHKSHPNDHHRCCDVLARERWCELLSWILLDKKNSFYVLVVVLLIFMSVTFFFPVVCVHGNLCVCCVLWLFFSLVGSITRKQDTYLSNKIVEQETNKREPRARTTYQTNKQINENFNLLICIIWRRNNVSGLVWLSYKNFKWWNNNEFFKKIK